MSLGSTPRSTRSGKATPTTIRAAEADSTLQAPRSPFMSGNEPTANGRHAAVAHGHRQSASPSEWQNPSSVAPTSWGESSSGMLGRLVAVQWSAGLLIFGMES